jgi:nitrile hydratase
VFQTKWEARIFALTVAVEYLDKWSLDESRYAIEDQHPVEYLRNSYYENWLISLERLMIEKGLISQNELESGAMDAGTAPNELAPLHINEVERYIYEGGTTKLDIEPSPQFEIGDMVSVANINSIGHTRLPRYVRGKRGIVQEHHGAHVFPDQNALGNRMGEHLYSVYFTAAEIWGNVREVDFGVNVDLWEPYLEVI